MKFVINCKVKDLKTEIDKAWAKANKEEKTPQSKDWGDFFVEFLYMIIINSPNGSGLLGQSQMTGVLIPS